MFEKSILPVNLVDNICAVCDVNSERVDFSISRITKEKYIIFDQSLCCFMFDNCVMFINFDTIKSFLFQVFDNIIEDKTVILFLVYMFSTQDFTATFRYLKDNVSININDCKIIDYLLQMININASTRDKTYCLKFVFYTMSGHSFVTHICREEDFDMLVDPRYY